MNISLGSNSMLLQKSGGGLKSTKEKLERQQKAQSQIAFFEERKQGLKNMQCETLEEIAQKLELFNNYDAQIAAVKSQYNREQMLHCMDEARELGEKIAEAAEKNRPKTEEERKCEQIKEALGIEDEGGMLTELLEELPETEELTAEELINKELVDEELAQEYLGQRYRPIDVKV